ncbi:MAG: hypothetical protein AB1665_03515 [Candidatus Thermoplasmatota archaeon]
MTFVNLRQEFLGTSHGQQDPHWKNRMGMAEYRIATLEEAAKNLRGMVEEMRRLLVGRKMKGVVR